MGRSKNKRNSKFAPQASNLETGTMKNKFAAIARSKALQRRKNTILEEYKHRNKKSYIADKRLDSAGSRYAALKAKSYKTDFNATLSNEHLTHGGRTLNEIENFEDVGSEDEEIGGLDRDFVESAHFGGGMLNKSNKRGESSYKDVIEQLIIESKRKKEEQKKTKEQTSELTKELDSKLQPLMSLFSNNYKQIQSNDIDEYDNKMKELQLDRSRPVERSIEVPVQKTVSSLPTTYSSFQNMLSESPHENLESVIKNIVATCPKDRRQIITLFVYLLQYIDSIAVTAEEKKSLSNTFTDLYKVIIDCLFELVPSVTDLHMVIEKIIVEKHNAYKENADVFPGLNILFFLKTISCLFSNSNSTIGSICVAFIDQMLTNCKTESLKNISYGLFLVSTVLQYGKSSEGYLPSAFSFLIGVLYMAIPQDKRDIIKESSSTVDLVVTENNTLSTDSFKLKIIHTTLKLLKDVIKYIEGLPSEIELLESFCKMLQLLPWETYPKETKKSCSEFVKMLEEKKGNRKLNFLVQEKKKPQALRLYEPNIQKVYEHKRTRGTSKGDSEQTVLVRKLKKERKGAVRELRRDRVFLAKVKIDEQLRSDKERYAKIKRIYSEGNVQQAELNILKKKKGKK
ncbi:nucleolar protein 14 homolog isoform X2 [Agrilus planipennis]|uniref:Nucleolar protein 14 homolog isoform X2 n=1 Tax=Agrilus planipennis TaxID=224129 RepID=A0A1W4XS95_AGRPL|nr:nucleolar protein 14 homolog isoform X2 [Agrilus planipennis]